MPVLAVAQPAAADRTFRLVNAHVEPRSADGRLRVRPCSRRICLRARRQRHRHAGRRAARHRPDRRHRDPPAADLQARRRPAPSSCCRRSTTAPCTAARSPPSSCASPARPPPPSPPSTATRWPAGPGRRRAGHRRDRLVHRRHRGHARSWSSRRRRSRASRSRSGRRNSSPSWSSGWRWSSGSSGGALLPGLLGALLGLRSRCPARTSSTGAPRSPSAIPDLLDGISFVAGHHGALRHRRDPREPGRAGGADRTRAKSTPRCCTRQDWADSAMPIVRGTGIGILLGLIPGIGAIMPTMMSYVVEKRGSRAPRRNSAPA